MPELVRASTAPASSLQGLTIEQPSLDDVFLRVTGEAMLEARGDGRDEAPPTADVAPDRARR